MDINESLTQGPIKKHLLQMAIPMSIGLFFNTMFNVVDTYYAGQLGTASLAGMSVSFSVFFVLTAVVSGLGTGLAALLSNAIGAQASITSREGAQAGDVEAAISHSEKSRAKIELLTINGLILTVVVSLALTLTGYFFSPFLLAALGAKGEALVEGTRYVRGIYAGALFFGINATLNALLSSRGMTKPYRNFLVFGFFLNLLLDPLFIFGWFGLPKLGTLGVAIATVICQLVGTIYLARKVHQLLHLKVSAASWKLFSLAQQFEILAQGIPAALNMLTIAIGIFVINFFIYRFGNDASTAGYGAAIRLEQMALLPAMGLNSATLTLVGQNYGAGRLDRVKASFFVALKNGIAIMTIGMVLIYPLAPFLIGVFNNDPQVILEGTRYLRIEFLALNAYVIMNVCLSLLQGLKKPQYAVWIGVYRQLAMPLLLFNLLGATMGLGLVGVWWGIVFTTWTGAIGMLFLTRYEFRKIAGIK